MSGRNQFGDLVEELAAIVLSSESTKT